MLLLAGLISGADLYATHLVGGSMSYEYLGLQNNGRYRYRVTVKMYRDCAASSVQFDPNIDIGVYNNNSQRTLAQIFTISKITEIPVNPPSGGSNCSFQPNVCIRQAIYQGLMDVNASTVGYHLVFIRCCRNTQQNIIDDMGQTYYAFIPNTSINNSSPYFTEVPAPYICRNDLVSVYNTAKDKDGDSLVYELNTPWSGGGKDDPIPTLSASMSYIPNFPKVIYKTGYNVNNPFGNAGVASIDPRNGVTTLKSPGLGRYSIAVDVYEYRNNVLISKIRLDIQMIVIDCPPNTVPEISTTNNQTDFTVMEGKEICFDVKGFDADNDNIKLKGTGDMFDGILGSKATFAEATGKGSATSKFCWKAPCGSARSTAYPATFEVDDDGCPSKKKLININIKVDPFVGASQIVGPSPVCADANGQKYYATGQSGSTFTWTVQGGSIVSGQGTDTVIVNWDNAASGQLTVKETNDGGCEGQTVKKTVVMLPAPTIPVVSGPDTACAFGKNLSYSIPPTSGYTYTWSASGGTINSGAGTNQINVDWGQEGSGFVRIIQTNSSGCPSDPDTFNVAIIQNRIDSLLGSPSVCPNSVEIDYSIQSPDPQSSYIWTVNQGTQAAGGTGPKIEVNWGNPATGYVEVYEVNKFGCKSPALRMGVLINHQLTGMNPVGDDTLCEFSKGIPYKVISTNGEMYLWSINGGAFTKNDSTANVTVDWGSTGTAQLSIIERAYDTVNQKSCISPKHTINVFLAPKPKTNPIIGPDEICQSNDSQLYYQNGFDKSTFQWVFNGGNFSGQGNDSIEIYPAKDGNFILSVIETSQYGCVGPNNTKNLIIHPRPVTKGIFGDSIICYPHYNDVVYNVSGFSSSNYNWGFDGGSIQAGQGSQQVILDFNGQANNHLTVQEVSYFGCPGDTLKLDVFADNPSLHMVFVSVFQGDDSKIEVKWDLVNAPRYNSNYTIQRRNIGGPWLFAGTTTPGNEYYIDRGLNTDKEIYEYRILGFNLCRDSIFSEIHRHVQITGQKPNDDNYAVNVYWTRYLGWNDGVNHYELFRKSGDSSYILIRNSGQDTSDFYSDGTTTYQQCYRVKATENTTGIVSWSNEICFGFDPILFLPTAFTPNGDRINDDYTWYYASIKTFHIRIYDRWGELLYEGDKPDAFWNGIYRGQEVPDGVYAYVVNYTGFDGHLTVLNGNVTILR